jgi:hypothetical protein
LSRTSLTSLAKFSAIAVLLGAIVWVRFYTLQGLSQTSWSEMTRGPAYHSKGLLRRESIGHHYYVIQNNLATYITGYTKHEVS